MIILIFIIAIIVVILSINSKEAFAHEHSAYSHEDDIGYVNKDWMGKISGDRRLSQLSIPGTHDSLSLYWGDIVQTQSMSLKTQLNSGIRFLDVRCYYERENYFEIYHGVSYQYTDFETVLDTVSEFLRENPTETVLMRIKQENSEEDNQTFNNSFLDYVNRYPNLFWDRKGYIIDPELDDVRGKIVPLYNVGGITFGIGYGYLKKYDKYSLDSNWDLYGKWEEIKAFIPKVNSDVNDGSIYLTYLSGAGGTFPYFVVSGHSNHATGAPRLATGLTEPGWSSAYPDFPRVDWFWIFATIAFEGTNILTKELIDANKYQRVGIVATDFPGKGLIESVIRVNDEKTYNFEMYGHNYFKFATLDFDLVNNKLNIQTISGIPNPLYQGTYLDIKVYDENYNMAYGKEFIGDKFYDDENVKIDIREGYGIRITSEDPRMIQYGGIFDNYKKSLVNKSTFFTVTEFGLVKDNENDTLIKLLGFENRNYGNVKVDIDSETVHFITNPGVPHEVFEGSYANIEVLDENFQVVYNKNYIGNQHYEYESNLVQIKDKYKINITNKEPSRIKFYRVTDNKETALKDKEEMLVITKSGLVEVNSNNLRIKFLGYSDREYANLYLDLDNDKLILKTNSGKPHFVFEELYLRLDIFDKNDSRVYIKDYIANTDYISEMKILDIQEGYKIKFISKEPTRVRFDKRVDTGYDHLEELESTFIITNYGLKEENRDTSLFALLGFANRQYGSLKVDYSAKKIFITTYKGIPHLVFQDFYLKFELLNENNAVTYTKYFDGNKHYEYEFNSLDIKIGYKIKITSKEPIRVKYYKTLDATEVSLQNKETTFLIGENSLIIQ